MAKWGEGDPRWIVEERADATNVNNWHWTEKNATQWSKDKLRSLLIGLKIEGAAGVAELKEFTTLEGEASANNRKSKLIFFYEWDIKMKWKGLLNTEDMDEVSGTLTIPNLSDEQDLCDIEVEVTVKEKNSGAQTLKELVRTRGADQIRESLSNYLDSLREEFSQGMVLPTDPKKENSTPNIQNSQITNNLSNEFKQASIAPPVNSSISPSKPSTPPSTAAASTGGVKISTKKISMKEQFMCAKEEIYRALTEQNMVQAFTRSPIKQWDVSVGGKFILFDGMISGEFQQLIPNDTIIQRWRMKSWPDAHYSVVTIKLSQSSNSTTLTLSQTGIPSEESERTKEGWRNYYWNSIRQTFGFAVDINF